MTYTQGPWKFEVRNNQAMVTTERDDIDMVVASNLFDEELDLELEEVEANARLIALAPTLLRIVKTLEGAWDCDPWDVSVLMDKAIDEAREAIAKAEGRA